jgi:hypothetical protein
MLSQTRVEDSEPLLRSVLDHPDWVTQDDAVGTDLLDGRPRMLPGGFKFEPDGPSVYRRVLLQPEHSPEHVRKRPDAYVFEFSVNVVREFPAFDASHAPEDKADDLIGYAHTLIIYKVMPMDSRDKTCKSEFRSLRLRIIATAEAVVVPPPRLDGE